MLEDNICPICGGQVQVEYHFILEHGLIHAMRVLPDDGPIRLCPGHDSTLFPEWSLLGKASRLYEMAQMIRDQGKWLEEHLPEDRWFFHSQCVNVQMLAEKLLSPLDILRKGLPAPTQLPPAKEP